MPVLLYVGSKLNVVYKVAMVLHHKRMSDRGLAGVQGVCPGRLARGDWGPLVTDCVQCGKQIVKGEPATKVGTVDEPRVVCENCADNWELDRLRFGSVGNEANP